MYVIDLEKNDFDPHVRIYRPQPWSEPWSQLYSIAKTISLESIWVGSGRVNEIGDQLHAIKLTD